MNQSLLNIIRLGLLLIAGSSLVAGPNDTVFVTLTQTRLIDVCSDDPFEKSCLIEIDIGKIEKSDSLYGYDFDISYDYTKLIFNTALYIGTLSEKLEERDVLPDDKESGRLSGYAVQKNPSLSPVSGDLPLLVLKFDYKGECPDSASVYLRTLDFTDEFKRPVDDRKIIYAKAIEADKPERFLYVSISKDTLFFEKDSILTADITFTAGEGTKLDTLRFDITVDDTNSFRIIGVEKVSDKIEKFDVVMFADRYEIAAILSDKPDSIPFFNVILKSMLDEDITSVVRIGNITTNVCSCITKPGNDSVALINKKDSTTDTTTSLPDDNLKRGITGYYDDINDKFIFECEENLIEIQIYDINGAKIFEKNYGYSNRIVVNGKKFNSGIYLFIFKNINNELKRIVLIKSYY